jgi:ribonuclease-3
MNLNCRVRRRKLRALLKQAGVKGIELEVIETAFTHESAVREGLASASNERLEFLGDAVLGFIVARWLFTQYPDAPEGELALRKSSLVRDMALADAAERLGFGELLVLGAGLAKQPAGKHRSTLADAFEAFIAALVCSAGIEAAERFVIQEHLERTLAMPVPVDAKTMLQEWTQKRSGMTPVYIESVEGPAHERVFHSCVVVSGESVAEGTGPSKKIAQQAAARAAIFLLREEYADLDPQARVGKT